MSVILFTGKPGSGKSYRIVAKLMDISSKYYVFHNIDGLNHDFFDEDGKYMRRWDEIEGFLTLTKQKEICGYIREQFNRPVLVVIDEAQSQGFASRNQVLLDWISYHRHLGQDIWLVSQSLFTINRDFTDRCDYECRAKRGIATNQFIYQYAVSGEVFKTDRVAKRKAVFKAYKSFEHDEMKKPKPRLVVWASAMVILAMSGCVYTWCFGMPHLFGAKEVKGKEITKQNIVVGEKKTEILPSIHSMIHRSDYSYAGCMGNRVLVQKVDGGSLMDLEDIEGEYVVSGCDHKHAIVKFMNKPGRENLSKHRIETKDRATVPPDGARGVGEIPGSAGALTPEKKHK